MEKATFIISLIATASLFISAVVIILADKNKTKNTKAIVYGAVMIALAFALSFVKWEMPNGGSITLASFMPLIIYAYMFGSARGLLAGMIYGFLQFIQAPWFVNVFQFLLDYPLAFMSIAVAGFMPKFIKKLTPSLAVGAVCVAIVRFIFHLLAGILFYSEIGERASIIFVDNSDTVSAFTYSFLYNITYVLPDIIICIIALVFLSKNKVFEKLIKMEQLYAKESLIIENNSYINQVSNENDTSENVNKS